MSTPNREEFQGTRRPVTPLEAKAKFEKFFDVLRALNVHDALLQFSALPVANDVLSERVELHRDFVLGHRIAWIALWNIHAR